MISQINNRRLTLNTKSRNLFSHFKSIHPWNINSTQMPGNCHVVHMLIMAQVCSILPRIIIQLLKMEKVLLETYRPVEHSLLDIQKLIQKTFVQGFKITGDWNHVKLSVRKAFKIYLNVWMMRENSQSLLTEFSKILAQEMISKNLNISLLKSSLKSKKKINLKLKG